jgi:hypothetical protein
MYELCWYEIVCNGKKFSRLPNLKLKNPKDFFFFLILNFVFFS